MINDFPKEVHPAEGYNGDEISARLGVIIMW